MAVRHGPFDSAAKRTVSSLPSARRPRARSARGEARPGKPRRGRRRRRRSVTAPRPRATRSPRRCASAAGPPRVAPRGPWGKGPLLRAALDVARRRRRVHGRVEPLEPLRGDGRVGLALLHLRGTATSPRRRAGARRLISRRAPRCGGGTTGSARSRPTRASRRTSRARCPSPCPCRSGRAGRASRARGRRGPGRVGDPPPGGTGTSCSRGKCSACSPAGPRWCSCGICAWWAACCVNRERRGRARLGCRSRRARVSGAVGGWEGARGARRVVGWSSHFALFLRRPEVSPV